MEVAERLGGTRLARNGVRIAAIVVLGALFMLLPVRSAFAGALRVRNINGAGSSSPTSLADAGGTLYFGADDGTTGIEPWLSNGTFAGTHRVKDIRSGAIGSYPYEFTTVNTAAGKTTFFAADDGVHGYELWKTNGTSTGTKMVKDIWPGVSGGSPMNIVPVPEHQIVVFVAIDGTHGYELWKSNGTAAGTTMIRDIDLGSANSLSSQPADKPVDIGGEVYFGAYEGFHGDELWKTDGTTAGTKFVKNIAPGTENSHPSDFINLNGTLLFHADDGNTGDGDELWRSNGTSTGTTLVKDINPGVYSSVVTDYKMTKVGNGVFFRATDSGMNPGHGMELWRTNGTQAGTVRVKDINPGTADSSPDFLANVNGTLFFSANDGTHGQELWKSNGLGSGTSMVKNIDGTAAGSYPSQIVNDSGIAVFAVCENTDGCEPWESDGTPGGTHVLANIATGNQSSNPNELTYSNGYVFFRAADTTGDTELWKATP
jgi:ELWxxDGT repeat protein